MARSFATAHGEGEARALRLLPGHCGSPAARRAAVERGGSRAVSPALVAALCEQNAAYGPSEARTRSCDALGTPGTVVVVTGQQVGLLLGPLYTLYKAASAVVVARALERETGVRAVPIFWLQTEDHDFAEVRQCHVQRPGAPPLTVELPESEPAQARTSVAHRRLGDEVTPLLDALAEELGALPHAASTLAMLRAHYRPGEPLGAAFAGLLAELFRDQGLLLLDPRQPSIAHLAAPVYRTALGRSRELEAALAARGRELRAAGFDEQVPVRPGATLLCFHQGSPGGPRYRLARSEGSSSYRLQGADAVVTEAELQGLLETDPLRFSTSALLRPLVQDSLLPTAATVGGPHELDYLAQLSPAYELLRIPQPLLVPRARFRLLDPRIRSLLGKLGLSAAEVETPRPVLLRRVATPAAPGDPPPPEELGARMREALAPHLATLEALHPSLRDPVRRARASLERMVARLVVRHGAALAERDQVAVGRVDRLRAALFPEGLPQERYFSFAGFASQVGAAALVEKVLARLTPFDGEPRDIEL